MAISRTVAPHFFTTPKDFRQWLVKHSSKETEVWVGFYKKSSGRVGMNYDQALDEALCFGWIDGIVLKHDALSYKQRFTPRRAKSIWSKINTQHVERLIREKKMMPPGLAAVEAAKKDGRWDEAYDSPSTMTIPKEFFKELNKSKQAKLFFKTLTKANTFAIAYRLKTAKKEETKIRRTKEIIAMLARGEKIY